MTSDSSNSDRDVAEQLPALQPRTSRYEQGYDGAVEVTPKVMSELVHMTWFGIVLAMGYFPIVLGGAVMIYMMLTYGVGNVPLFSIVGVLIFGVLSFFVGGTYGIIMSIPAFVLMQFLRWSLKGIVSDRGMSGAYGGMTGFLCISGGGLFLTDGLPQLWDWEAWLLLVSASLLAVAMGHAGAIWYGYRHRNLGFPFIEPIFSFEKRITIGYLMKLTFVFAVITVVLKAAGMAGLYFGIAWMFYLLWQTVLLACDQCITRRLSGS